MKGIRPAIYLTNLATVSACRRRGGRSGPAVGTGPVIGILRRPPAWATSMLEGHVRALMPTKRELFDAKVGRLSWDEYRARLVSRAGHCNISPGGLTIAHSGADPKARDAWAWDDDYWRPSGPVPPNATLVCTCAVGELCHRQIAADLLAEAGWFVVLDGQGISYTPSEGRRRRGGQAR